MNLKLFKILAFIWWINSGKMEELLEKSVNISIHQIPESKSECVREKGIDVSHWQGKIDWDEVANSNVKHVFIKMTEGKSYADPNFVENWNGAQKAGLNVNCYHYFRALNASPTAQMENIKRNLKLVEFNPANNTLAIDVEHKGNEHVTPSEMADNLNALLKLIKEDSDFSNLSLLIYTSPRFWDSKVQWEDYDFSAYGLWVAHYEVKIPRLPEPWRSKGKSWVWWQYSSRGHVKGIAGKVDLDWVRFN